MSKVREAFSSISGKRFRNFKTVWSMNVSWENKPEICLRWHKHAHTQSMLCVCVSHTFSDVYNHSSRTSVTFNPKQSKNLTVMWHFFSLYILVTLYEFVLTSFANCRSAWSATVTEQANFRKLAFCHWRFH